MCRAVSKRPPSNLTLEEVLQWAQSFEKLMATKYGPVVYAAYLKMEHSDENIKFWMACETYKKIASRWSRTSRAKKLYKIYIQPESPREINIDSSTRETIIKNIREPTPTCFEEAQKNSVYAHGKGFLSQVSEVGNVPETSEDYSAQPQFLTTTH